MLLIILWFLLLIKNLFKIDLIKSIYNIMITIYHTYCDNCEGQHHYIPNTLKETSRCKYCGVYLDKAYDLECNYLNDIEIICLVCDEI